MVLRSDLPTDVATLQALLLAAEEHNAHKDEIIERKDEVIERKNVLLEDKETLIGRKEDLIQRLEKLVADYKRALFGSKSEKANADQYQLAFEDIETALAAIHAEDEDITPSKKDCKKRKSNRGSLPKHLERIEEIIEPEETSCSCGAERHVIGEDVSERLDVIPAQFRVIVTRRPKYACRSCEEGIVQAPAKPRLIEGGLPTEATVASVIVSKYADHCPLYRQAQIYARQGIDLDRSTLASWVGKAAYELKPVYDCLKGNLKTSSKLFMDETTAPVLEPGRGKVKRGYFWALARDDRGWNGNDPPGVAYTYAPGRGGKHAVEILEGFEGVLQVDGYSGYNRLLDPKAMGQVQLAYCWAHARRKLYELTRNSAATIAEEGLKQIASLYRIESQIKGQSVDERLRLRQQQSAPKIEAFRLWLDQARGQVSAKSPTGEALNYIHKYWNGLILFLVDGRIEIDSNAVERTIRPIALNRKNALFAGHEAGAQNWAILASLIETCKLNDLEPLGYLSQTLTAIVNGHEQRKIEELLPWELGNRFSL